MVRSLPDDALRFVPGSAAVDGASVTDVEDNPFAHGPGVIGYNLGAVAARGRPSRDLRGRGRPRTTGRQRRRAVECDVLEPRVGPSPVAANERSAVPLDELARRISALDGVAHASQLSFADLGSGTLASAATAVVGGPAKIFGFDTRLRRAGDPTSGSSRARSARTGRVLSAEAARRARRRRSASR